MQGLLLQMHYQMHHWCPCCVSELAHAGILATQLHFCKRHAVELAHLSLASLCNCPCRVGELLHVGMPATRLRHCRCPCNELASLPVGCAVANAYAVLASSCIQAYCHSASPLPMPMRLDSPVLIKDCHDCGAANSTRQKTYTSGIASF